MPDATVHQCIVCFALYLQLRLVQSAEHQLCAAADFNEEQLKKKREEEEALALKKKKAKQDVIDLLVRYTIMPLCSPEITILSELFLVAVAFFLGGGGSGEWVPTVWVFF